MHPDDEKRLQRELDIYRATRGPDYSRLEGEISRAKDHAAERQQAGEEARAREKIVRPVEQIIPYGNPEAEKREAYGRQKKLAELNRQSPREQGHEFSMEP